MTLCFKIEVRIIFKILICFCIYTGYEYLATRATCDSDVSVLCTRCACYLKIAVFVSECICLVSYIAVTALATCVRRVTALCTCRSCYYCIIAMYVLYYSVRAVAIVNCIVSFCKEALAVLVCSVEAVESTAVYCDCALCCVVRIERPLGCLTNERTAVDDNLSAVLYVDNVEVRAIVGICCANVGVCTAVDHYLTAICPDYHAPGIVSKAVYGSLSVDGELTACYYVEYSVALGIIGNADVKAVKIYGNLLIYYNCSSFFYVVNESDHVSVNCVLKCAADGRVIHTVKIYVLLVHNNCEVGEGRRCYNKVTGCRIVVELVILVYLCSAGSRHHSLILMIYLNAYKSRIKIITNNYYNYLRVAICNLGNADIKRH